MDPHGRVLRYLRVSVTDRCNLRCRYCMPAEGIPRLRREDILSYEQIAAVVQAAVGLGVTSVRITGGEPLVRRGIVNLVRLLAQTDGLADLSMTTNGILLPAAAQELARAGLRRVNISIDSLDPTEYAQITRGGDLRAALDGVHAALAAGLRPVKVNAVALAGETDDDLRRWMLPFVELADELAVHVRFIELMPIGALAPMGHRISSCGDSQVEKPAPPSPAAGILRVMEGLGGIPTDMSRREGAPPTEVIAGAGPARYWRMEGARGCVGLIAPMSAPFCDRCNRLRLTARGELRRCIFSAPEIDLRPWLSPVLDVARPDCSGRHGGRFGDLAADGLALALAQAWITRPPGRGSPALAAPGRTSMCQIGG